MKKIVVIGAAGMIGKPVTQKLIQAGFEVTAVDINGEALKQFTGIKTIQADLEDLDAISAALKGQDAVYLSIQTPMHSTVNVGFQPEREGIKNALKAASENGIKRVLYLSSILKDYQGQDGFDWWVYRIKQEAENLIVTSGIPYYIFKPSTFYENVPYRFRQNNKVMVAGDSSPMWWNSASYLGDVVAKALKKEGEESKTYFVQGPEPLTALEGSKRFIENYKSEPLQLVSMPFEQFEPIKDESPFMDYLYHITKAMNNYKEEFQAQETWDEFGKPEITIADYAKQFKS